MTECFAFIFSGRFQTDSFTAFVGQRARRLDIAVVIREAGPTRVIVEAVGQDDLLGAFEMACSLGPADALVREVLVRRMGDPS